MRAITEGQSVDDPHQDTRVSYEYKVSMSVLSWQTCDDTPAVVDVLHGQNWVVCPFGMTSTDCVRLLPVDLQ